MIYIMAISIGFLSKILWATVIDITVHDPVAHKSYSTTISQKMDHSDVGNFHRKLLISKESADHHRISFSKKEISIDGQKIERSIPMIDGLPVEGADGVYVNESRYHRFQYSHLKLPSAEFRLNAAECMERAIAHQKKSMIKNPYVERTDGLYQPLWIMHFGEVRPAFKIRLPTISIFDLKDIYVDANNGEILRIDDSAQFISAPSHVFVYSPGVSDVRKPDLRQVMLNDLISIEEDGFLLGEYMSVKNCCKYFTCPEEGECTDDKKRCALKSHKNARQRREVLELPTGTLGLDPMLNLPPNITVDTVRCTFLPFAKASHGNFDGPSLGFFDVPIDDATEASEMDRFSEIQAYYSMMSFFKYIRKLLNDDTWCLREEAMSCDKNGKAILDQQGKPKNPYRVFVNQLIPDMKIEGIKAMDPDSFINQIIDGRGTEDNPIKLDDFIRIGNAAFVPALSTLKKNAPRADELLSDLIKPFDHNVFFQGERDFAYDGDVVFHEFMHAITTSLISKINSLGLDKWGIHSEPGSLNEGWADYFSGSFTDDPKIGEYASVQGGFGEAALRNIDNDASCPEDVIGEIHNDSLIWSGALFEIRSRIKERLGKDKALEFDRAVLASLAQATTTEDFKTQSEKVLINMLSRKALGQKAVDIAEGIFKRRGIKDCFRVITLSTTDRYNKTSARIKNLLFIPSKNQIGLKNYAPAPAQLEIGIPASAKSLTISWKQYLAGTGAMLGTEATPHTTKNVIPLGVLKSFDRPIEWKFQKAHSVPTRAGVDMTDDPESASYLNGYWQTHIPLDLEKCQQKTLYVSLLSNDFKYVLQNISVSFDMDKNADLSQCDLAGSRRPNLQASKLSCSTTDDVGAWIYILMVMSLAHLFKVTIQRKLTKPHQ